MSIERRELLADVAVHALGLALGAAGVIAMLLATERGQLLPGGEASNNFLFVGLGLITGGFLLSTMLR